MIVFDYLTAPQSNSTVIIAAGPSTTINKDKISQYIQQNNSIVFAANYNYEQFGIKSNFTYFTDIRKLREQIKILILILLFVVLLTQIIKRS